MNPCCEYLKSSIGRKQIVAATGLLLILFVVAHLAGNLIIYLGPEAFNNYAKKLAGLRPGLYFLEVGLLLVFLTHMWVTATLVWDNINARPVSYTVSKPCGERSLATRLMTYSGAIVLAFVIWHLYDFTFADKYGARSFLPDGKSYGLFGIVYNSFADPTHGFLYIIAIVAIGLHLSHGIQSFFQTFGFVNPQQTIIIKKISNNLAMIITVAYSSIPVYVYLHYRAWFY